MTHSTLLAQIRLALGAHPGIRLFQNPCGVGWLGALVRRQGTTVTLANARRVTYGLTPGSSDLIGWRTVVVTPEMVGTRVAVFAGLEIKTGTGRAGPEQRRWRDAVLASGGVAGVVRSVEDAEALIRIDTKTGPPHE